MSIVDSYTMGIEGERGEADRRGRWWKGSWQGEEKDKKEV